MIPYHLFGRRPPDRKPRASGDDPEPSATLKLLDR